MFSRLKGFKMFYHWSQQREGLLGYMLNLFVHQHEDSLIIKMLNLKFYSESLMVIKKNNFFFVESHYVLTQSINKTLITIQKTIKMVYKKPCTIIKKKISMCFRNTMEILQHHPNKKLVRSQLVITKWMESTWSIYMVYKATTIKESNSTNSRYLWNTLEIPQHYQLCTTCPHLQPKIQLMPKLQIFLPYLMLLFQSTS